MENRKDLIYKANEKHIIHKTINEINNIKDTSQQGNNFIKKENNLNPKIGHIPEYIEGQSIKVNISNDNLGSALRE
jgi:hypothetical protein